MADLPSSRSKIQIEETKYKATVSENTQQKIGGAINHILDNSVNGLGDVVQSILSEAQFQTLRGDNWVLMSGQSISGSDLNTLTGITSLPDATGNSAFFRQGASVGTYQGNQNKAHTHAQNVGLPGAAIDAMVASSGAGGISGQRVSNTTSETNTVRVYTDSNGGSEARPNNYQMNFFIKINNDPTT